MDDSELLLGSGLILVSLLNCLILVYVLRQEHTDTWKSASKSAPKSDANSVQKLDGSDDYAGDRMRQQSESDAQAPPSRPTTKAGILAWRNSIIKQLEEERGTKVITMIHKKELWTAPDEEPEIAIEDTETVLQQLRHTPPDKPVDLILHTPGGYALAAQMMAMAIKFHPSKVTVMVPFYAMSGGSLMSLAANEIRMEKYSVLGPVDPQIPTPDGMWPASSLATLLKTKPIQYVTDRTVIMSDVANLETENAKAFVLWLLEDKMQKEQAERVADFLARGYMSHATPITLDVARALGLNVVEGVPERVYELFKTFAFSGQTYKRY